MQKTLKRLLKASFFTPSPNGRWACLPMLMWGPSGGGKTALAEFVASLWGFPFHRMSPGELGEGYFGATPVPGVRNGIPCMTFPPPEDVLTVFEGGYGVLFIDEITRAFYQLQNQLLGLVQLGKIGTYRLPPGVRVLGAANEVADCNGGFEPDFASNNRFGHWTYEDPTADDWSVGAISRWRPSVEDQQGILSVPDEERRVLGVWPVCEAWACGLVTAFVRGRPTLLRTQPKVKKGAAKAWASPRTCDYAIMALASSRAHGLSEIERDAFMSAFVGQGWVAEFAAWQVGMDLPSPEEVLDGRVKWAHDERRLDRTQAVLSSCASLLVGQPKAPGTKQRAGRLWNLLETVAKAGTKDIVIPAARSLVAAGLVAGVPEAVKALAEVQKTLAAARVA